jgi:hypothetical protein
LKIASKHGTDLRKKKPLLLQLKRPFRIHQFNDSGPKASRPTLIETPLENDNGCRRRKEPLDN